MDASGGATAGGAYLLRAKERYNARVAEGAKAYKKSSDIAALFAENEIDINAIPCLQREDWRDLGVPIGHKARIVSRVRELHPEVFS